MLQTRNGKCEWNLNDAHIIIPMIDGDMIPSKESDKMLNGTITLNTLEGSDQTVLTNLLEHGLVFGVDKNLFDTGCKNDLLIIQNSDLKLLPCSSDLEVEYTFSHLDKGEVSWQNPVLKEKICAVDKTIFEVKQISSEDSEKSTEEISLENINVTLRETKEVQKTALDKITKDLQCNNYPELQENVLLTKISKPIYYSKSIQHKKTEQKPSHPDTILNSKNLDNDKKDVCFKKEINNCPSQGLLPESTKDFKDITNKNLKLKDAEKTESGKKRVCDLEEKNLPLKKKAKMKKTLGALNSERSLLKHGIILNQESNIKSHSVRKFKESQKTNPQKNQESCEASSKEIKAKKNLVTANLVNKAENITNNSLEPPELSNNSKTDSSLHNLNKFNSIFDLIEHLRNSKIINTSVWQMLYSGLKEMKVDILKEMLMKMKDNCLPESLNYSPQLKAFALVLYFRQPAAFNNLSQMYKTGWPPLKVIKEWKRRMNTFPRPNRVPKTPE